MTLQSEIQLDAKANVPEYYRFLMKDADLSISWHQDHIFKHPIQTDYFNCGIFTIIFIEQYVFSGKLIFQLIQNLYFHVVMNKIKIISVNVNLFWFSNIS
jgi:hypothetical protein